jgi:hypothetical protein
MDKKIFAAIIIPIFILAVGCSGEYGNIRKQTGAGGNVTLEDLKDKWEDYDVYYGMRSNRFASALLFDPKDNGTKLAGDSWIKIEDQENLNRRIKEIQTQYDHAGVHIIENQEKQVFGYIYYPIYLHLPIKVVDERTLYVSTLPPYKSAP